MRSTQTGNRETHSHNEKKNHTAKEDSSFAQQVGVAALDASNVDVYDSTEFVFEHQPKIEH